MMANRSYWTKRRLAEREWQTQQFKDDDKFAKKIQGLYENTIRNINREIDRQIGWLADRNGSSYAEMLRAVDNYDVQEGEELARKLVAQANAKRAVGQKVHYGDFTKEQNAHLRLYNATMRINRLEYLKSMVGLECLDLTDELNSSLGVKLTDSAQAEFKRQAGIMGKQLGTAKVWTSYDTQEIVMTSVAGGTWSERLWRDQDVLKAKLDEVISTGIVSGDNSRKIARSLKDNVRVTVNNQRAVTERLARTETARVQYQAQLESIKGNGFKWVEWFAEPGACRICQSIANKDNGKGAGIYQIQYVPAIPDNTHPNCRCSIGSYYSDEMLDEKLKELGFNGKKKVSKGNDSLVKKYLPEKIAEKLGQEVAQRYASSLDKAPDFMKKLYTKHMDAFKVDDISELGKSYYNPRTKGVTLAKKSININNENKDRMPVDVVFHEFGHLIDYEGGEFPYARSMDSNLSILLHRDWLDYNEKLVENVNRKEDLKSTKITTASNGQEYYGGYRGIGGVRLNYKKDGTFTAVTKRQLGVQLHYEQLNEERKKKGWLGYTDVSDMVEAVTRGKEKLGYGHGTKYWTYPGMQEKEFFAECSSATINNPESLKVIKKHFPTAYKEYVRLAKEIGGSTDE